MSPLWQIVNDGMSPDYLGTTPGPLGLNDAADPSRRVGGRSLADHTPGILGVQDAACARTEGPLVLPEGQLTTADLTPREYMRRYRELEVPHAAPDTGHVCLATADVHVYVNDGLTNRRSNVGEKNAVQSLVRRNARSVPRGRPPLIAANRGVHNLAVAHAYYGKGAPWQFRIYLAYALSFGRTTAAALEAYCDRTARLGIDCSGFVNSYLTATGRLSQPRGIQAFARNTARTAYDQIQPCDLLVWQGSDAGASRHIAIVDELTGPNEMRVVESSGSKGGLAASTYTVQSVSGQIFQVDRGLDENGNRYARPSSVKIVAHS